MQQRGLFVVLEGLDRCGKTSQLNLLRYHFQELKRPVETISFPNRESSTGQIIDKYLKGQTRLTDQAIHLLFSADRWERQEFIIDKLEAGVTVIADRYVHSGVVYSAAKGLDLEWCKSSDRGLLKADMTLYLDVDEKTQNCRNLFGEEIYEKSDFQLKVACLYRQYVESGDFRVVDARGTQMEVLQQIKSKLSEIM